MKRAKARAGTSPNPSFAPLNGISYIAKIGVKKDKDGKYPDQNVLTHIVTPDEKEWQMVMSGQAPAPASAAPGAMPGPTLFAI